MYLRLLGISALMMGGIIWITSSAGAGELGMDYWFIETLMVGNAELPEGVIIRASDPEASPRGHLILQNQTKPLLFVLSLGYKDVLVMVTPDPNWRTRVNAAHEVASYLVTPDQPVYLGMEALTDLDHDLQDRNVLASEPPAEDIPIPAAQDSELLLVYDGQVIVVPFTISYALNLDFNPASEVHQQQKADPQTTNNAGSITKYSSEVSVTRIMGNNMLVIGLVVGLLLLIIGWRLWRVIIRNRNSGE
jgi:hypothetical protein